MRRILATLIIENVKNRHTGFITVNMEVEKLPVKLEAIENYAKSQVAEDFEVKNIISISDVTDILENSEA